MKPYRIQLFLSGLVLFFVSDISNAANCSCLPYFENKAKPNWIGSEQISDGKYSTYGSTYCTGLQKVDTARADDSAKANLTRMIQAQIQSTQKINQGSYGNGVAYSHLTEKTTINTDLILNGSFIYDRWVDPESCTLFSATQIPIAEVEKSIAEQQITEAAMLVNQVYSFSQTKYPIVISTLESMLSELKIKFGNDKNALIIKNRVFDLEEKPGKLVNLRLEIEIFDPKVNQTIWKKSYSGKGLSFNIVEQDILINKALNSALKKVKKEIQTFIMENSR